VKEVVMEGSVTYNGLRDEWHIFRVGVDIPVEADSSSEEIWMIKEIVKRVGHSLVGDDLVIRELKVYGRVDRISVGFEVVKYNCDEGFNSAVDLLHKFMEMIRKNKWILEKYYTVVYREDTIVELEE